MGFKQDFHGTSMICSEDFFGNSMGLLLGSFGILWYFYDVSLGLGLET